MPGTSPDQAIEALRHTGLMMAALCCSVGFHLHADYLRERSRLLEAEIEEVRNRIRRHVRSYPSLETEWRS